MNSNIKKLMARYKKPTQHVITLFLSTLLGDPEVTANIYCKSRNLPNSDTKITVQNYGNFWVTQCYPSPEYEYPFVSIAYWAIQHKICQYLYYAYTNFIVYAELSIWGSRSCVHKNWTNKDKEKKQVKYNVILPLCAKKYKNLS